MRPRNKFYEFIWSILRPIFSLLHPLRVEGLENVPQEGPVLLCPNHSSAIDPILLVIALGRRYPIRIMAKQQLLKIPVLGAILRGIGVFPVDRGNSDIGTTKRGIGPTYMDKYERCGLRIYDLVHPEIFAEKARTTGTLKNKIITAVYGGKAFDLDAVIAEYTEYGKRLAKYVDDVSVLTYEANKAGKTIMFEGAQATLLDIDFGTYPYVTSSHPIAAGACIGTGVGPKMITNIIGVAKAYTTRVGKGPFPTELNDETGDTIRNKGGEFGTTTGRPRRTGWFDAVIVRHSVRTNGLDGLAINKLDTLSGIGTLKMCVGYQKPDGTVLKDFPAALESLADCSPIYEEFEGFDEDISGCKSFDELPEACKKYIARLEEVCECKVVMVGNGPDRSQILER